MKVILSRKGFDSSAGKYPSPHLIDSRRLISFPIPEDEKVNTSVRYSDLRVDQNHTYLGLMEQLGIKKYSNGTFVHLDPDINATVIERNHPEWRGVFGQSSAAQSHLARKNVQVGDLFLFFGWFKDVVRDASGYRYVNGTDRHIIWGYMQVGEIELIDKAGHYDSWKLSHPHYKCRDRDMNTAYIAAPTLSFNNALHGSGTFNYSDSLVLTKDGQRKRSVWKLPNSFHPSTGTKMSYHENIFSKSGKRVWESGNNHCILNSVGRGQEFIVEGNKEVENWAKELVQGQFT
ncbi:Nmad3 family putative nucleotide modification protein [Paenibacillus sp. Marseille-Q7038]